MHTTLDKANSKLAKASESRQVDDTQFQRLSAASYYLSNFLAQTPDGIVGLDAALHVIQWNDSAGRQWDITRRRALSLTTPSLTF